MKKILIFTVAIIFLPLLSAEAELMASDINRSENIRITDETTVSFLKQKHEDLRQAIIRHIYKINKEREKTSLREEKARIDAIKEAESLLMKFTDAMNAKYGGTVEYPHFPTDLLAFLVSEEDIICIKQGLPLNRTLPPQIYFIPPPILILIPIEPQNS